METYSLSFYLYKKTFSTIATFSMSIPSFYFSTKYFLDVSKLISPLNARQNSIKIHYLAVWCLVFTLHYRHLSLFSLHSIYSATLGSNTVIILGYPFHNCRLTDKYILYHCLAFCFVAITIIVLLAFVHCFLIFFHKFHIAMNR